MWTVSASLWTSACAIIFAAALGGFAHLHVRALALKVRLLERREHDLLEAASDFGQASRESSGAVLDALERALFRAAPGIDATLVFEGAGAELAALRAGGERARHYGHVRIPLDGPPTPLTAAAQAGHRAALAPGLAPVIPTDRGALAVPLGIDEPRSFVYVSTVQTRTVENADTVVRLVEQARAPFALARERETDRARATYDGLTGLLTPRAFRTLLTSEFAAAQAAGTPLCLWFIDTDHFKAVNDSRGHAAGDVVLQCMARLIGEHVRPGLDHVARNGGDEFCAILKSARKSEAIVRAQRLCDAVAAYDFEAGIRITASIGVASFPGDAAGAHDLLEVADAAMYHSKHGGRNCVSFARPDATFERYIP